MNLDVYNTHIELYPYTKDDYPVIENMYSVSESSFGKKNSEGEKVPCGYFIEDGKLLLPRGTSVSKLERICGITAKYINESDPIEYMERNHSLLTEPRDELQEESIKFLTGPEHQLALNLLMGKGKAQPISTMIPTPSGYIFMGDIEVGDIIFGSDGKPTEVIGVYPQGVKDVYEITFSDGRKARCCKDHLWNIENHNNIQYTVNTDEIYHSYKYTRWTIPVIHDPVEYNHKPLSSLGFECIDKKYFIPNSFACNDYETRVKLLERICKNDGFDLYSDKYIEIESTHPEFICKLRWLLLGLNYVLESWNKYKVKFNTLDKHKRLEIIKVRKLNEQEECVCIKVSAKDQLYLTEDFIITHNTFCVAYASTKLKEKAIIITPSDDIKHQWMNTYHKMFGYREEEMMNIIGSTMIENILYDNINPVDLYFVNHQTLHNYMTSVSGYALHQFFKKLGVGIKVYDESHLQFSNILLIDCFSNTNRTWYLTATFDRSDKEESKCFKRAFNSVITFGDMESYQTLVKHVIYHKVEINSNISFKDKNSVMGGFQGFTGARYGKYAIETDPNQTLYKSILKILNIIKDVEGKILIFVPLINNADEITTKLKKDFPYKSVAAYHSKISQDEKESAIKKDIIVSTIKSCGTGRDIPGLRSVICCEPVASKLIAKQMFGRLRPYAEGKDTYFFDIVDICIPPCNWWWRARFKAIEPLAKNVIYLNIDK